RLLVPEEDLSSPGGRELGDSRAQIAREAAVDLYLEVHGPPLLIPSEAEVLAFYEENPERFEQLGRRFVWNIFRRERPDEDAAKFLEDLRMRWVEGESFRSLAKGFSDSETRLLGGRLGWIVRGRLPQELEDVLFALENEQVTAPLKVRGGFALFQVTDAFYAKTFQLADARLMIARHLARLASLDALDELVADVEAPPGAVVLADREEIVSALPTGTLEQTVLQVEGPPYTVAEWYADTEAAQPQDLALMDAEDYYVSVYREKRSRALISLKAAREDFPSSDLHRERLAREIDSALRRQLFRARSGAKIEARIARDPSVLEDFHRQNAHLFQSPLRLEVLSLEVQLSDDEDAAAALRRFEDLRSRLESGALSFEAAAREAGGRITPPAWLDPAALGALSPKVRLYLTDLGGTGFSIPFQLDRKMIIAWVRQRQEPERLTLEDSRDAVLAGYLARHGQRLYQESLEEALEQAGFVLHRERLERRLMSQEGAPPAS
ncbi:MAG: peptidyl-prolyl cis-trans isomerase, partial [Acidobacteriota bacterium]